MSPSTTEIGVSLERSGHKTGGRTLVGLALLLELAGGLDRRFAPVLLEVRVAHDLTTDELVLEVRAINHPSKKAHGETKVEISLNNTSRLRSFGTAPNSPSTNFVWATCKVTN